MNPADAPPNIIAANALEWFKKARVKATILYTVDKNGKTVTSAATNAGPQGMAQHLAAARIQDGSVERAAIALHELRVPVPPGVEVSDEDRTLLDVCPLCGQATNWSQLPEIDREGHRDIVKVVVGHALAALPAPSGLVPV